MRQQLLGLSLLVLFSNVFAELTPEQLESWFSNDKLEMPEESVVQDEKLRFILQTKKLNIPITEKTYRINANSITTGWVGIEQCYRNLDPVSQLEIVYDYRKMRELKVTSYDRIGKLWIEGQSIQMENVTKGAFTCTSAEVQILRHPDEHNYLLLAGPFKRKFLDGYYPMHVKLSVFYPAEKLRLNEMYPKAEPGFHVTQQNGLIQIDSLFSGKLYLAMSFNPLD